jgi:hypothetical protein
MRPCISAVSGQAVSCLYFSHVAALNSTEHVSAGTSGWQSSGSSQTSFPSPRRSGWRHEQVREVPSHVHSRLAVVQRFGGSEQHDRSTLRH